MQKYCNECGARIADEDVFCGKCGMEISKKMSDEFFIQNKKISSVPNQKVERKSSKLIIASILLIVSSIISMVMWMALGVVLGSNVTPGMFLAVAEYDIFLFIV